MDVDHHVLAKTADVWKIFYERGITRGTYSRVVKQTISPSVLFFFV